MPQAKKPKKLKTPKRPTKKNPTPKAKGTPRSTALRTRGLTPSDRMFCREYIMNGGNATQAAMSAGLTESVRYAQSMSSELLSTPYVEKELKRLLSMAGLDDETLARGIWEGIRAFKITYVEDSMYKDEAGEPINGGFRPLMSPDFTARAKYFDMIAKLNGKYAPLKVDIKNDMGDVLSFLFGYAKQETALPPIELKAGENGYEVPDDRS